MGGMRSRCIGMILTLVWMFAVLAGHTILFLALWGRLTAIDLPRLPHDAVEATMIGAILLFPFWIVGYTFAAAEPVASTEATLGSAGWLRYDYFCVVVLGYAVPSWLWRRWRYPSRDHALSRRLFHVDRELAPTKLGHAKTAWAARIPGNQIFDLEVNEKRIPIERLSPNLEGLTIVHLSDFHFTGGLARPYFEFVTQQANQLEADLVFFTGDALDEPDCLEWFPSVFGSLQARHGVFAILGNHDKRMGDVDAIRRALETCGVAYLGGRWEEIKIDGERLLLAGNESPWLPATDLAGAPSKETRALRLLLTHTPDQFPWARTHQFDLALAGHTHGGQVRLPMVGPILAPSRFGTRYASGLFYEEPTWMHVSRGVSGLHSLRIRCRPEITRLILTRP